MSKHYYQNLNSAFLAHFARRLSDLIAEQGSEILKARCLKTPASSISAMLYLSENQNVTVALLAKSLGVSHQMATQRSNFLEKLGLIERVATEHDKRSKIINLTKTGKQEVKKILPFTQQVKKVFDDLEDEIGCELATYIRKAELSLRDKPIKQRI